MTNQEAIEVLKLNNPFMAGKDKETFSKAIDKGIEALEKQKTGHWKKISPSGIMECSVCGGNVLTSDIEAYKYCHHCGAKMKIEGENK